jgi:hypothetical protein
MRKFVVPALALALALPVMAQTSEEPPPEPPPPKRSMKGRWFVGGGIGASFGTVDSIALAPLIGFHVVPRFDVGTQLYYRWVNDGRYSPSVTTNDYGVTLFARARVVAQLFLEANYQFTNYEYVLYGGGTARSTYSSFLAGAGYAVPVGKGASVYFSALYDFGYDANDPYLPYDSPWHVQIGAMVGF